MATIFGPPYVTTTDNGTSAYGAAITWPCVEVDYRMPPRPLTRDSGLYRLLVDTAGDYNANVPKEKEEAKPAMRGLYEGFVYDPETERIEFRTTEPFVADSDQQAQNIVYGEAAIARRAREIGDTPVTRLPDCDIIVRRLGDVRGKKAVQEVKVVK